MPIINTQSNAYKKVAWQNVLIVALTLLVGTAQSVNAQQDPNVPRPPAPEAAAELPTLFIVGDSTARNNANEARGWGDELANYFDNTKVKVVNRAYAGRSSRTFIREGRWDKVLKEMKRGDFVLIQMSHSDLGTVEGARARASLPGTGDEVKYITLPNGELEVVHTYGWYLRKMISDTKAKQATPVILSLTVRNIWTNGKVERGFGQLGQWAAQVAAAQGVNFVDLTNLIADQYEQLGQDKVKPMFGTDYIHTSPAGADLNAAMVVVGLKRLKKLPLTEYLSARGLRMTPR